MRPTIPKLTAIFLAAATIGLLIVSATTGNPRAKQPDARMATLSQTYIATGGGAPLQFPPLATTDGRIFAPEQLRGHWSVVFFGFTACPLVCPKTLALLTAVAHNPASGIAAGTTQPVFVSIDPEHDTPESVGTYLKHFDNHIIGLTGSRDAVSVFSREAGAGYQPAGSAIDHSSSLFVVDPHGRLAGVLLRPNEPHRIVADLAALRLSRARAPGPAGR